MKKLKLISNCLLGLSMIGLFSFALFSILDHKQKGIEVRADYSLGSVNGSGLLKYRSSHSMVIEAPLSYNASTTYVTNDSSSNYLSYSVSLLGGDYFKFQGTSYNGSGLNYNPQTYTYNALDGVYPTNFKLYVVGVDLIPAFNRFDIRCNIDWYLNDTLLRSDSASSGGGAYTLDNTTLNLTDFEFSLNLDTLDFTVYGNDSTDSYLDGFGNGYDTGYTDGYNQGYNEGYSLGYEAGVESLEEQLQQYYQQGYTAGYTDGYSEDSTISTIFSGIIQVALVPVNFFLGIFNFEILGINLRAFIQALFTIAVTIIIVKMFIGSKGGGSDG